MTSHLNLIHKQDEYEELMRDSIAHDAAILIKENQYSTNEAIEAAKDIAQEQAAALNDPTGTRETLLEAQSPQTTDRNNGQILAIKARVLREVDF